MADRLLERLHSGGYSISGEYAFNNLSMVVPVAIQCFEADALVNIRNKTDLPLVLLMKEPSYNESYLDYAMTFADGIGPDKTIFAPAPDALDKVSMARSRGFYVHPFTFRADQLIEPEFNDNFDDELVSWLQILSTIHLK